MSDEPLVFSDEAALSFLQKETNTLDKMPFEKGERSPIRSTSLTAREPPPSPSNLRRRATVADLHSVGNVEVTFNSPPASPAVAREEEGGQNRGSTRRWRSRNLIPERKAAENTVSTKLQLSEARAECEELRRKQVVLQGELEASRLEAKREATLAKHTMDTSEKMLLQHKVESLTAQELLTTRLHEALDKEALVEMDHEEQIAALQGELELSRQVHSVNAASVLQRAFHQRYSRVLQVSKVYP